MVDLDEMERLLAAATSGEWQWDCGLVPPDGPTRYADIYTGDLTIASFNDLVPEGRANAALTVAAINALPQLIVELRAHRSPPAGDEVEAVARAIGLIHLKLAEPLGTEIRSYPDDAIASVFEGLWAGDRPVDHEQRALYRASAHAAIQALDRVRGRT